MPPFTIVEALTACAASTASASSAPVCEERLELKQAYRALFMGSDLMKDAIAKARERFTGVLAEQFIDFFDSSERGTCPTHPALTLVNSASASLIDESTDGDWPRVRSASFPPCTS